MCFTRSEEKNRETLIFFTGRYGMREPEERVKGDDQRKKSVERPKRGVKGEEIVFTTMLKGESDVFFCRSQSSVAQAGSGSGPEPEFPAGQGLRTHQLWGRAV